MCDPVSIGVAVVGAAASFQSSKEQAEYQGAIAERNAIANNQAVRANLKQSYTQTQRQYNEMAKEGSDALEDNYMQTLKASDTSAMLAAERGVDGHSVDAIIGDVLSAGSANQMKIEDNLKSETKQMTATSARNHRNAQNGLRTAEVYKPSSLTMGLKAAQTGLQIGATVRGMRAGKGGTKAKKKGGSK